MIIGTLYQVSISQNLILNSAAGITLGRIKFGGGGNGVIQQLGSQAINISELTMAKTGTGKITLSSPLTVTSSLALNGGNIVSGASNNLIFLDNVTYTGGGNNSFVDGPLLKTGDDAFIFPVGQQNVYAPVSITAPLLVTDQFRAQYFKASPHAAGYDSSLKDPGLHHISSTEYWVVDRVAGTSNVKVTLTWDAARSGIVNNIPDLRVGRWNGSLWKDEGNGAVTGTIASGTVQSLAAVNNFSPFTLASATLLNPLPVTLVDFTAAKNNGNVLLQWTADNEINIGYYQIERSNDGRKFDALKTISAFNTSGRNTYSTVDDNPVNGINYYRIKIIDRNGRYEYSNVLKIDFTKKYLVSIMPNPVQDFILINGANNFKQIQLIDASGKIVKQFVKTINNRYSVAGLSKGMYLLLLIADDERQTQKIVIE
jgi:hypothetical protein